MTGGDERGEGAELEYYRAVEDLFARLRGTRFILSPKDFSLLRDWWRAGVPFAAVVAGLSEVFERRRSDRSERRREPRNEPRTERQVREADPVSSLSYCRHAVARHAKRLAASAIGERGDTPDLDVAAALDRVAGEVDGVLAAWQAAPALAAVLADLARAVRTLPREADPGAIDETLGRLEVSTLAAAGPLLAAEARARIDAEVERAASAIEDETARARVASATRARLVREALGLPRLELVRADA